MVSRLAGAELDEPELEEPELDEDVDGVCVLFCAVAPLWLKKSRHTAKREKNEQYAKTFRIAKSTCP